MSPDEIEDSSDAAMDHEQWTAEQEQTTVTVDGHELEMAFYDSATPNSGPEDAPPVVFLHGIPTWGFLWRRVAPAFEDEFRVVVPDLVGYGNSAHHEGFDRSIRAQEQALSDLLDVLGTDRVHLVAHDIGAGVALRFASRRPGRVEKLVISNGVCYDSWPVEFITDLGLPRTAEMDTEEFEGKLQFAFGEGTYSDADPAFVAGMKAPWLRDGGRRSLARAAVATNTNHTTEIEYGKIEADLLCLWGEDDVMQPIAYGERLADEVGGELVRLKRAYHWVVEDRPEAYREHLRAFLTESDTSGAGEN